MTDSIENIKICCSACGKEMNFLELEGQSKKICPNCEYSLFMLYYKKVNNHEMGINIKDLSKKQIDILNYITNTIENTGVCPSVETIKDKLVLNNISTVYYHLNCLKEKGYITFKKGSTYTIKVLPKTITDSNIISDIQFSLLRYIDTVIRERKEPPVTKEMQERLGFSSSATLAYHIDKLSDFGLVAKIKYQHKSLKLTKKGKLLISTFEK